ncbi:L-glutamate gamma-semialdehyde dehydrogenase, partial [Micromonospora sp. URMC 105]|uniref:L-glutamate gamma-semialdehyde dehydrogenase n=1 Tax=Micromonospora sp. URMC 105 TaxID=3423413 RepID=UPI003F1A3098
MDAVFSVPEPRNEPVRTYEPGSADRERLQRRLTELAAERIELPMTIAGEQRMAGGESIDVVQPHKHAHVLGVTGHATHDDARAAVKAAKDAAPMWRALPFEERAAIFLRAAELLAGPWRDTLNAATMLGQSKTVVQAEIDSACEFIDFLRFNVHFARRLLEEQPVSSPGVWNRFDHRPLEGFVYAVTPFNFTAIAGNLPSAPALLGNTVVWKPGPTQQFAAHFTMRLFEAAGLPPGVINMVTGRGEEVSDVVLADPDLAGIHFTGSTKVFQHLWRTVGENIAGYRGYPRLVGETGGKDFVVAHTSADVDALHTALIRGAYEYQGQKCSAASRAYVPRSLWEGGLRDRLAATTESLTYGDVTDFSNFGGAVIDEKAFSRHTAALELISDDDTCRILAGGTADDSVGYFVRPTLFECSDLAHETFTTEYFGPILGVHVFDDARFDDVVTQAESIAPYALTGSIFANDRRVVEAVAERMRYAAGNFYINDKPTGAVVG